MNRPIATPVPLSRRPTPLRGTMSCPCSRPCHESDLNSVLMQHGDVFRFERGDRLWGQGDPADSVVAVCTGAVKSVREWPNEKSMIMEVIFRGGVTGAEAAVTGLRRPSTCIALSAGRAVRVGIGRLRELMGADAEIARMLMNVAVKSQNGLATRLDETQLGTVEQRLARVLLRIGDEVGIRDSRGVFVPVAFSRGDLADLIGCRVETTIRIMTRWQREEVVDTQREGLVLRNREALEAAAAT